MSETTKRPYARLWRLVPSSLAFLLLIWPLAIAVMVVAITGISTGAGLLITFLGFPVLWTTLWIVRGTASISTRMIAFAGAAPIPPADWGQAPPGAGWLRAMFHPLRTPRYWAALAHQMIVQPVLATATFVVITVWVSLAAGGLTSFAWRPFVDQRPEDRMFGSVEVPFDTDLIWVAEAAIYLAIGIVATVTLPWVVRGCVALHVWPMRWMLGRWDSDDLRADLQAEATARDAAVRAEDRALRRLERDLHDGPQQGLIRIQMDLDVLARRISRGETAGAQELVAETRDRTQTVLDELRALSAGVAPPLLADRGLSAALTALAATAPVPVTVRLGPGLDAALGPEVARTVYFTIAELLTNIAKHSGASEAWLEVELPTGPHGSAAVTVTDDGRGGAQLNPGRGLDGLTQRLHGVRGTLHIDSPAGGPTRIRVTVPTAHVGGGPVTDHCQ